MAQTESVPGTGISFKKGGLHESLGVPQGQPIPANKMSAALSGKFGAKAAKQARLAQTLEGMNHKKRAAKRALGGQG